MKTKDKTTEANGALHERMKVPFGLRPGCVAAREDASATNE